jgi:hypothetical protein
MNLSVVSTGSFPLEALTLLWWQTLGVAPNGSGSHTNPPACLPDLVPPTSDIPHWSLLSCFLSCQWIRMRFPSCCRTLRSATIHPCKSFLFSLGRPRLVCVSGDSALCLVRKVGQDIDCAEFFVLLFVYFKESSWIVPQVARWPLPSSSLNRILLPGLGCAGTRSIRGNAVTAGFENCVQRCLIQGWLMVTH